MYTKNDGGGVKKFLGGVVTNYNGHKKMSKEQKKKKKRGHQKNFKTKSDRCHSRWHCPLRPLGVCS